MDLVLGSAVICSQTVFARPHSQLSRMAAAFVMHETRRRINSSIPYTALAVRFDDVANPLGRRHRFPGKIGILMGAENGVCLGPLLPGSGCER